MKNINVRLIGAALFLLFLWTAMQIHPLQTTVIAATRVESANNVSPSFVAVLIELQAPPVAQIYADRQNRADVQAAQTSAATQAQLATIEAAQQKLLTALKGLDAQVIYRNQRVYNGIAVHIAAAKVAQLWQLPDIKAVHPLIAKRPATTQRAPLSGAPSLWQGSNGIGSTGKGVTIAIIDTGVDYLHVDLGGSGTGYTANDPTQIGDVPSFPNAKVIGGYDFAGNQYNAEPDDDTYQPLPAPDPDPMDCYAHGTHVAGIAAGSGVNADGTPYTGDYTSDTDFSHWKIPPGMAPQAQLYAVKVFGCTGSSEIVDQGIEWAVDPNGDGDLTDHVDVINLSLGSPYGSLDDPTAIASENAAAAGVIVVASAGNSADATYVTGSPAIADHVISVAAGETGVTGLEKLASFSARGPRRGDSALKPDVTAPGVRIVSAAFGTGNGGVTNSGTSMAAPHVAGALALLHQIHPSWSSEDLKALVMNSAMTQIHAGETITAVRYSPVRIGAGRLDLEQIPKTNVIAYNADNPGLVSVSFGAPEVLTNFTALKNVRIANKSQQVAAYTLSYAGVTDIPGVTFHLPTDVLTVPVDGFINAPILLTADSAQMQRTRDQTLSTTQGGQARQWLSEKAGYLLFWPAAGLFTATLDGANVIPPVNTNLSGLAVFRYSPQTNALSYTLQISGAALLTETVVTINRGPAGLNGTLAYTLATGDLSQGVPRTGVINLDPADEAWLRDGALYLNLKTPTHPEGLLRGQLHPTEPVLSVPIYAAPRPAAAMHAAQNTLDMGSNGQSTQALSLQGTGLTGAQEATATASLVSAVGLQWSSPDLPPANLITGTESSRVDLYDHADLKYVGVTSDWAATHTAAQSTGAVEESTLYFGLATYGNWSTPNEVRFEITIDTNQDGADDYVLFNADALGYSSDNATSDAFVTALKNLHNGLITPQLALNAASATSKDTAPYNTSVLLLPIKASALGLTDGNARLDYYVESYSNDRPHANNGERLYVDRSPRLSFILKASGLDLTNGQRGAPQYQDTEGNAIPVGFDLATYTAANLQGILLLHHHNLSGQRAEVVSIAYHWPNSLYLPIIIRQ